MAGYARARFFTRAVVEMAWGKPADLAEKLPGDGPRHCEATLTGAGKEACAPDRAVRAQR
jgi:hypothetical protein